jgi:hypothetical protein
VKKIIILLLIACACIVKMQAQDFDITTIAGCDSVGTSDGDGRPAINARLYNPEGIHLDGRDDLYIADYGNQRIRKIILSTSIITTIAGTDIYGYSGDGGPATDAALFGPEDIFTDTTGNIFFADGLDNCVRKINISTGIITTVVGTGTSGSSGDDGLATNATLNCPSGLCLDKFGNIYIAEYYGNKVRKVEIATGIITTLAGTGTAGNTGVGGPATSAEINGPANVFLDSNSNLFFSDSYNNIIRRIDALTGIITTVAGTGMAGYSGNGGLAINAELNGPARGYFDKNYNLFFADYNNGVIRRIDVVTGIITTVAGNGIVGFSGDGGPAVNAKLDANSVAVDSNGIIYISDVGNNRIRMVYNTLAVSSTPEMKYSVYPNPANDELNIDGLTENTQYRMLSVTGACLQQGMLVPGNNVLSIKNLVPGVYILELTDGEGQRNMVRVVKE